MDFNAVVSSLNQEAYQELRQAVEIGKWANGEALTEQQRSHALRLVIAYGERYLKDPSLPLDQQYQDIPVACMRQAELVAKSQQS